MISRLLERQEMLSISSPPKLQCRAKKGDELSIVVVKQATRLSHSLQQMVVRHLLSTMILSMVAVIQTWRIGSSPTIRMS